MEGIKDYLRDHEVKMYDKAVKLDDVPEMKHWERVARSRQKKKVG